ncbi:hypothetical protein KFQ04_14565 [Pseudomonas synxantha]|nr:hypothetical protein KFQ04_14565 [Pseudomonas synxantha]
MCGLAGELRFDHQPADLAAVERITHHLAPVAPTHGASTPKGRLPWATAA